MAEKDFRYDINAKGDLRVESRTMTSMDYTEGETYALDMLSVFQKNFYRCIVPIPIAPPAFSEDDWELIGVSGGDEFKHDVAPFPVFDFVSGTTTLALPAGTAYKVLSVSVVGGAAQNPEDFSIATSGVLSSTDLAYNGDDLNVEIGYNLF